MITNDRLGLDGTGRLSRATYEAIQMLRQRIIRVADEVLLYAGLLYEGLLYAELLVLNSVIETKRVKVSL